MRQCRFCGHINDDALIYCISCDSPLDHTIQSRIPEELQRAIAQNKQHLAAATPSSTEFSPEDDPGVTWQGVPASAIFSSSSASSGSAYGLFDPGQSYEMASFPVIHQSGEVASPFFAPDSAQALNPTVPTMIQRNPEPPSSTSPITHAVAPAHSVIPQVVPAHSVIPQGAPRATPISFSANGPKSQRTDFVPVAPTTEYQAPTSLQNRSLEHHPALPVSDNLAAHPNLGFQKPALPSPSNYPDTNVPQAWESQIALDDPNKLPSLDADETNHNTIPSGLKMLSSALMLLLMMVCGGFVAVFLYMYFFGQTENLSNPKSHARQVWNPLETPVRRESTNPSQTRPSASQDSSPLLRLQRVLQKAHENFAQQEWSEAQKKLHLVLAAQDADTLHPEAKQLLQRTQRELQAAQHLQQAKISMQQSQWPQASQSLVQIAPETRGSTLSRMLWTVIERNYATPRLQRNRRHIRRRQYKKAKLLLQEVLQVAPHSLPAQQQWTSLEKTLKQRQTQCLRSCSRIHRKHRKRRNWCQHQCRKKYPLLPPVSQLLAGFTANTTTQTSATSGSSATTTPPPTTSKQLSSSSTTSSQTSDTPSPPHQNSTCRKRCQRWQTRWKQCQHRQVRRFRYWCKHRCRQRFRGQRQKQCYRSCDQNLYTRQIRKPCASLQRQHQHCTKSCR